MDRRLALAVTLLLGTLGAAPDPSWRVGLRSYGPIEFGVTIGEVTDARCDWWKPFGDGAPSFMVVGGRVVRIDVTDATTRTRSGVGVGSSEEEVKRVYGSRIGVGPHKYTADQGGRYLTYVPRDAADARFRVIFETDGTKVTRFRAGTLPEVEYVEGCL